MPLLRSILLSFAALLLIVPQVNAEESAGELRLKRLETLAEELEAENAEKEALFVRSTIDAERHYIDAENGETLEKREQRPKRMSFIAQWIVGFYRAQISPAIGARCVLDPSCSQYFLEASRKHGLLGLPMIADRFVREPIESASDRVILRTDGQHRHLDPVEDHDWWF